MAPIQIFSKVFSAKLKRLYYDNQGDVAFVCGPLNKSVHSFLLENRSTVFDTMLNSQFQEGQTKRIELKEQNPYLAARMLQHFYNFSYSGHKIKIGDEEESSYVSELQTHVEMYGLGDEYDIKDLKEEALSKFDKALKSKKGEDDELTLVIGVIPAVYATTPDSDRGLRDIVVAFGASNLERMTDLPEFKSAATRAPIYLTEVLPMFMERNRLEHEERRYKGDCAHCHVKDNWWFSEVRCRHCNSCWTLPADKRVPAS